MHVKSIAECSRGAFCNTLTCTKLLPVFTTFVLSIFEWPFYKEANTMNPDRLLIASAAYSNEYTEFYTGFTVLWTCTKLPPVFTTFVSSIFEWPLKTGFTVYK